MNPTERIDDLIAKLTDWRSLPKSCRRFGCSAAQLRTGNADVDIGAAGWLVLRTFHHLLRFSRRSSQIILSYSLTRILYLNYGDSWDKQT
jgi:hypothetical protein